MTKSEPDSPGTEVLEASSTRFGILGRLVVVRAGVDLRLGGRRQRAVLARLLVAPGQVVALDTLVEDVWNGDPPPTATKTLQKYVSELRSALATFDDEHSHQHVRTAGNGYVLDLGDSAFDAGEFELLVVRAREATAAHQPVATVDLLRTALGLWRGEAFEDFPDHLFAAPERARLGELRWSAVEARLDAELALGRQGDVISELADLTAAHPLRERLWALMMTAMAESGRAAEALRAFRRYRTTLAEELGLDPSPQLCELERRIICGDVAVAFTGLVEERGAGRSNLPVLLTRFIGRRSLHRELSRSVDRNRLVTLFGTGGSGKTRLALEFGGGARERFPGGVWLVDLAPLDHRDRVVSAVADAIGVPAQPHRSLEAVLADALAFRATALLILDNCEHLAPVVAELTERLLTRCGELHVLATSRSPLGLQGEAVLLVPPMSLHTEAAELFCDRARLARNDVEVLPNDAAVLSICRQLDGLPLAIELAASAMVALEPVEIAARIGEQLLRAESSAPVLDRHRSLRASMEWSHDLLSPRARVLFRRVAVFPSTFSLAAAERVCASDGLNRHHVLGVLTELAQASLVGRESRPGSNDLTRYGLLQTVRAFAAELLERSGEHEQIHARHASMTLELAEAARRNVLGPAEIEWRDRLELARHDTRTALEYARQHDPALAFRIALALWPYWLVWGRFDEGLAHLRPLLSETSDSAAGLRAWALTAAADLASDAGEARQATAWAEEALGLFAPNQHTRGEGYALRALANAHYNRGHFDRAAQLVQAAAVRFERLDEGIGLIHVTYLLGLVHARLGNFDAAERTFWRALRWCTEAGSRLARARSLWILGSVAQERGDYEAAQDLCERSLEGLVELADTVSIARVQVILGDIARIRRETRRAARLYERAMITLREAGDLGGLASAQLGLAAIAADARQLDHSGARYVDALVLRNNLGDDAGLIPCLQGLATVHRALGQPGYAVTLLAAAASARSRTAPAAGTPPEIVAELDELRAELDSRTFSDAWTTGEGLSAEEIPARWAERRPERRSRRPEPRTRGAAAS